MNARQSIGIDGLSHLTAIPVASKVGPLLMSSIVMGFDPGTRDVPETVEAQLRNIFVHVGKMLEAAGASWNDIAKMNFWLREGTHRPALEPIWIEHFPDPASRPARHTQISKDVPGAMGDFVAFVRG